MKQNISKAFLKALDELEDCSVWCKQQKFEDGFIYTSHLMLNLSHGSISIKDKNETASINLEIEGKVFKMKLANIGTAGRGYYVYIDDMNNYAYEIALQTSAATVALTIAGQTIEMDNEYSITGDINIEFSDLIFNEVA